MIGHPRHCRIHDACYPLKNVLSHTSRKSQSTVHTLHNIVHGDDNHMIALSKLTQVALINLNKA